VVVDGEVEVLQLRVPARSGFSGMSPPGGAEEIDELLLV
jgi:hypothetical protein